MPFTLSSLFGRKLSIQEKSRAGSTSSLNQSWPVCNGYSGSVESLCCPVCTLPYDMGKKRKLIDVCGHQRCYTCVYQNENCQLCGQEPVAPAKKSLSLRNKSLTDFHPLAKSSASPLTSARCFVKTNGHFTYIKARADATPTVVSSSLNGASRGLSLKLGKLSPVPRRSGPNTPVMTKSSLARCVNLSDRGKHSKSCPSPEHDEGFEDLSQRGKAFEQNKRKKLSGSQSWDVYQRLAFTSNDRNANIKDNMMRNCPKVSVSRDSCASLQSSVGSCDANNSTSPVSTLTGSSETDAYARDENGSILSLMSDASGGDIRSPVIDGRRQKSLQNSSDAVVELENLSKSANKSASKKTPSHEIQAVRYMPCNPAQVPLKPLFFEVPVQEEEQIFVGRGWLFREIEMVVTSEHSSNRGVIITGNGGTGKTSIALQLVDYSCFGRKRNFDLDHSFSGRNSVNSGGENYGQNALLSLAPHLVAYHFCQLDNSTTCLVAEFVHSFAAQLCQAPQLSSYREYLLDNPSCLSVLSMEQCLMNPSAALVNGILEPLNYLQRANQVPKDYCFAVIDSIGEAEYHRADSGDTIASFLAKHILRFPSWLKLVITIRTNQQEILSLIPFHKISLNKVEEDIAKDLLEYISFRVKNTPSIRNNVSVPTLSKTESVLNNLQHHLMQLSSGCFLYLKLTLDLIQHGHLVVKSSNFKVLPVSLAEVFLLHCNLRFQTARIFDKVQAIMSTCLAALNPLNLLEIYHSVNCLRTTENLEWEDFLKSFKTLNGLLIKRSDGTYMFFHSSFRDWLTRREDDETKFLCDMRMGHAAISFRLSRIEAPLNPLKTLELGHHILKAHIYKNMSASKTSVPPRDLQAMWLANASQNPSLALACPFNIYYPNIKVSRLLLLAGASPNEMTSLFNNAPLLVACAAEGLSEMVSLTLEFGADINGVNEKGSTALSLASEKGHLDVVRLLVQQGALISQVNMEDECALVKAAMNAHLEVVDYFLSVNWAENPLERLSPQEAFQHALVTAAAYGHMEIVDHILTNANQIIDAPDSLYGETPLCVACCNGKHEVVDLLLRRAANVNAVNLKDVPPLIVAVREGHRAIVEKLITHGASVSVQDTNRRTALIVSAKEGHVGVMEILLANGGDINASDKDGLTPLSWASLRGHTAAVQCLLKYNVDVNHADSSGRIPLDLAAYTGNEEITLALIERGALLEHVDLQGVRPLDRAVGCAHKGLVQLFLKRGAKLGPATWTMATGKPEIILCLLNKLLEDGNVLLKKGQLKDAAYRFRYAIRKIPTNEYDEEMQTVFDKIKMTFMLQLSRCKRKMNESEEAVTLASDVLKMQPDSYKAFYARAKAYQSLKATSEALSDVSRAMESAGYSIEFRKQLFRLKEELTRESRSSPRYFSSTQCQSATCSSTGDSSHSAEILGESTAANITTEDLVQ